jgi:hypothetical protein
VRSETVRSVRVRCCCIAAVARPGACRIAPEQEIPPAADVPAVLKDPSKRAERSNIREWSKAPETRASGG